MPDDPVATTFLLTPSQVAAMLGVTPQTVTRYAAAGTLPAITLPGGHRRYRLEDVNALIDAKSA